MPSPLTKILKLVIILLIPVFIVGGAVRLMTTDQYLAFEYGKTSFPPDIYGFTAQQRFDLALANLRYVRDNLPSEALSSQTLYGAPVYTPREMAHMADVQTIFQSVLRVWAFAFIMLLLLGFFLWKNGEWQALASAIQFGGVLTSGIVLSIALLSLVAWQIWFDLFHRFFFQPGSWLFAYSDTLIRLFPVEFWSDATLTNSFLGLVGGMLLVFAGWGWQLILEGNRRKQNL